MSKFDLSEKLKKSAKSIKSTVEQLPESMGNINLVDSVKDLADKGTDTIQNFVKNSEKTIQTITESLAKPVEVQGKITIQDALKIIYFVIAADGKMDQKEKEMFSEIGKQFDPEFIEYQKEFEYELNQMIEKAKDEDFEDNIRDYIRDTIENSKTSKMSRIDGKLLIWNLLVIANCDFECSEVEKKLIRYITKQLEIDKSILLEMESYVHTYTAIEKEESWLKQSNRPFAVVDAQISELKERKAVVMQAVYALLAD